jgi:nitroimidazol reductase NimA-like FMN-containing flavoprotein (pyridoxamine 5'-phosphate oxidase superfamily)
MNELSRDEIDEVLIRNGVGVLSMVDGEQPYGIPMSFGYDGESLTFAMQFGTGYGGRKTQSVQSNNNVSLTVYEKVERADPDAPDEWRSVIISGELTEVEEANRDEAFAALAANADFAPDLTVWGIPFDEVELTLQTLEPEDITGRGFTMTQSW